MRPSRLGSEVGAHIACNAHCRNGYCHALWTEDSGIDEHVAEDEFIAALAALEDALIRLPEFAAAITERAEHLRTLRSEGQPYREIVPNEQRPLIVELLTENLEMLAAVGSRLRRAEARALYDEGLTMDEIAKLFGVTRQRIAALLR